MTKYHWTKFLDSIYSNDNAEVDKAALDFRLSVILLNRPIDKGIFIPLFKHASNIILWDGASNRLYDSLQEEKEHYLPTHIIGDMDSWRPEVLEYYEEHNVKIIKEEDQDSTDFQKSVNYLTKILNLDVKEEESKENTNEKVVVLFPFGGRIDQTLHSMHVLSKISKDHPMLYNNADVVLLDSVSTMQYLCPGEHSITYAEKFQSDKGWGVIPLSGKCETIKTQGLKWNLGNNDMEFGSLEFGGEIISTSNEIVDTEIKIEISHPVIWTTTLHQFYEKNEP